VSSALEEVLLTVLCQTMEQAKATTRMITLISDNSIRRRIDEMNEDVHSNSLIKVLAKVEFSLQLHEATAHQICL